MFGKPVYKIHVLRFKEQKPVNEDLYVVVGSVPGFVSNAISSGGLSQNSRATLSSYFGPSWAKILAMNPKKKGGGSDDDPDDPNNITIDDIDRLLAAPSATSVERESSATPTQTHGPKYVSEPTIYSIDKPFEIREKIYAMTGIPAYRQHIFWRQSGNIVVPYSILLDSKRLAIDFLDSVNDQNLQRINGLPLDKDLYSRRTEYFIDDVDHFSIIGELATDIYVVDLDDLLDPAANESFLSDSYRFDLLYHGFIVKFWPQMPIDIFKVYLTDQIDIGAKFPELARPLRVIESVYKEEQVILDDTLKLKERTESLLDRGVLDISITHLTAVVYSGVVLNVRNLFDMFVVSATHPLVRAFIEEPSRSLFSPTSTYRMDKRYPGKQAPGLNLFDTGFTVTIPLEKYHNNLWLNVNYSGRIGIRCVWEPEDKIDYKDLQKILTTHVNPVIKMINDMGRGVFYQGGSLITPTIYNITFQDLNISVFWKKQMTENGYKKVKGLWQKYNAAGLINQRGSQIGNSYDFYFTKGVIEYDPTVIDRQISFTTGENINNRYQRFSSVNFKIKWTILFGGRRVSMTHRTADIRFDVKGISDEEFKRFLMILGRFTIRATEALSETAPTVVLKSHDKKLRKLREVDPELYNMRKHGSTQDYSILCQQPRQPTIFSEDESSRMKKDGLFKYWNFTTNKPAYYACSNKEYPYLSFITGQHPLGFCLPCCGKTAATPGSKKDRVIKGCLGNRTYEDSKATTFYHLTKSGHVEPGRASKLPMGPIRSVFVDDLPERRYVIKGIEQTRGIMNAVTDITGLTPNDIADLFDSMPAAYTSVCFGAIAANFSTAASFSAHWRRLYSGDTEMPVLDPSTMDTFIIEMVATTGTALVVIEDKPGFNASASEQTIECIEPIAIKIAAQQLAFKYGVLIKSNKTYYNIVAEIGPDYGRTNKFNKVSFDSDSDIGKALTSIITGKKSTNGFSTVTALFGKKIVAFYTNLRNLVYGMVVEMESGVGAWIPIDESPIIPGYKIIGGAFDPNENVHADLMFTPEGSIAAITAMKLKPATIVGNPPFAFTTASTNSFYYFASAKEVTSADLSKKYSLPVVPVKYDPIEVNKAIAMKKPPKNDRKELIKKGIYDNYIYDMLMMEFSTRVSDERNNQMRKQLEAAIDASSRSDVTAIVKWMEEADLVSTDSIIIQDMISDLVKTGDKKRVKATMVSNIYKFDSKTISFIKQAEKTEAIEFISVFISDWTTEDEMGPGEIPNILVPCGSVSGSNSVCKGKKLILPRGHKYPMFLYEDVMANRIYDIDYTIDFFSFEPRPDQIITVTKYATDHANTRKKF